MEVLIHTSAPSGRKDDQRFKRQAKNFASFEPAKRIAIEGGRDSQHNEQEVEVSLHSNVEVEGASIRSAYQLPVFIDDTQLAVSALESQLLTESLKRRISRSARHSQHDEDSVNNQESSVEIPTPSKPPRHERHINPPDGDTPQGVPSGSVASKQLESLCVPIREDTGVGIGYIGSSEERLPQNLTQVSSARDHLTVTPQFTRRTHSSSWTGDDVPSQLPSSYSLSSENTSKASLTVALPKQIPRAPHTELQQDERVQQHARLSQKEAGSTTKVTALSAIKYAPEPPQSSQKPSTPQPRLHKSSPRPFLVSTPTAPSSPTTLTALTALPYSIHAPPPPTSLSTFETHITSSLSSLLTHQDLAKKYAPTTVARDLRTSERGFWSFDTSVWSAQLQIDFWTFLTKVVSNGSVGFGVWASRSFDEEESSGRTTQTRSEQAVSQPGNGLGKVQVFCWGEIVEHVYLLLYVASKSKIKKIGAVWIDAGGDDVVRMSAR